MFDPCKFISNAKSEKGEDDIKGKGNGRIR